MLYDYCCIGRLSDFRCRLARLGRWDVMMFAWCPGCDVYLCEDKQTATSLRTNAFFVLNSYRSRAIPSFFYVRTIRSSFFNSRRDLSDRSNFALFKKCDETGRRATPICPLFLRGWMQNVKLNRPKLLALFLRPELINLVRVISHRTGLIPSGEKNAASDEN